MTEQTFLKAEDLYYTIRSYENAIKDVSKIVNFEKISIEDRTNNLHATVCLPYKIGKKVQKTIIDLMKEELQKCKMDFDKFGPVPAIDDSWHPASEVPPADKLYMICTEKGAVYFASPDGDTWNKHIKYWKPIPPLPEEFGEQKPNNQ